MFTVPRRMKIIVYSIFGAYTSLMLGAGVLIGWRAL